MSDEKLNVTINADSDELKKSLDEAASKLSQSSKGNLYQYLFDRNSDCFCLKISE